MCKTKDNLQLKFHLSAPLSLPQAPFSSSGDLWVVQIPAGARKPRAGPCAGPQRSWLLYHSWAKHFSKHVNLKSEIHNELVSLVFLLRLRNTVKLASKGLPGQARSPGADIPLDWLFSHDKAALRSLNHKRAASALQGLM